MCIPAHTHAHPSPPSYVPRAGKETLLHLAFWCRVEKMHSTDPTPSVTVAFLDLHKNYEEIGSETISIAHTDWQMHYVVIDLKTEHVGHSIRPYLYIGERGGGEVIDVICIHCRVSLNPNKRFV